VKIIGIEARILPLALQRRLVWEARRLLADERIHPAAQNTMGWWLVELECTHDRKRARKLIKMIRRRVEDEVTWHEYKLGERRFHKCLPGVESTMWRFRLRCEAGR
jgi:hypothetical protein